jgi:3-phosphoshikimate 1-carboxyvinyltransferase
MSNTGIHPLRTINENLKAPPSKSMTQRAVAAALGAQGESCIVNPSDCDDALAAVEIAEALGAKVVIEKQAWYISPAAVRRKKTLTLPCRESALCVRLFAPMAAVSYPSVKITGSGTLWQRPMDELVVALAAFGVCVTIRESFNLPIHLCGLLTPGTASVTALHSSQTLSGLLMALPRLAGNSELTMHGLVSRPYIDMTLEVLEAFGIRISHENYRRFHIPGGQHYTPQTYTVEGDWSSAAYWLAVGAIGENMIIDGLRQDSRQADKAILNALKMTGAKYRWKGDQLTVRRTDTLQAFRFDASGCPDLFPPLVLLAAFCRGISRIEGVHRLYFKESNRAEALISVFRSLGARIVLNDDALIVEGDGEVNGALHGGHVSSFHDHRIAMAAACAGLFTPEPVQVDDMHCVRKSYPAFTDDLTRVVDIMRNERERIELHRQRKMQERQTADKRERERLDRERRKEEQKKEKQREKQKIMYRQKYREKAKMVYQRDRLKRLEQAKIRYAKKKQERLAQEQEQQMKAWLAMDPQERERIEQERQKVEQKKEKLREKQKILYMQKYREMAKIWYQRDKKKRLERAKMRYEQKRRERLERQAQEQEQQMKAWLEIDPQERERIEQERLEQKRQRVEYLKEKQREYRRNWYYRRQQKLKDENLPEQERQKIEQDREKERKRRRMRYLQKKQEDLKKAKIRYRKKKQERMERERQKQE